MTCLYIDQEGIAPVYLTESMAQDAILYRILTMTCNKVFISCADPIVAARYIDAILDKYFDVKLPFKLPLIRRTSTSLEFDVARKIIIGGDKHSLRGQSGIDIIHFNQIPNVYASEQFANAVPLFAYGAGVIITA